MENINFVFLQTIGIVLLAYVLKRKGFITESDGRSVSKLLMHTTFPALMIISTLKVPLTLELIFVPIMCMLYCGFMLLVAFLWFKNYDRPTRGVITMAAGGFNVGLFGFPMIEGLFGKSALVYAILFDIGNSIMIFGVVYGLGVYFSESKVSKINIGDIAKKIFSLPPLLAMIAGLTLNVLKVPIPELGLQFLDTLAKANKPLVLLLMGIYLHFTFEKIHQIAILKVLSLRTITAFIVVIILYFSITDMYVFKILAICALFPLGMTILPFSDQLGYDSKLAGAIINLSLIINFMLMWAFMIFV